MDPDPDPVSFVSDLQDGTKHFYFFAYYSTFKATLTSFFKDEKSKRSHKTVEIKVFHPIFAPGTGSARSPPSRSPLQYTQHEP
jgi:hypothetical protein